MSPKAQAVKAALASLKKKKDVGDSNPMEDAHENPAVESQENSPGKKVAIPTNTNKGTAKAKSRKPAWHKPKGTVENPTAAEKAGKVVAYPNVPNLPKFYQKAKTRGA